MQAKSIFSFYFILCYISFLCQPIHNIFLPARYYFCCDLLMYCRLHSIQLFVCFCNLLGILNHSTLSCVSLMTWYMLANFGWVRVLEDCPAPVSSSWAVERFNQEYDRSWVCVAGWVRSQLDHTMKEVFKGKQWINNQVSTFHFNIYFLQIK